MIHASWERACMTSVLQGGEILSQREMAPPQVWSSKAAILRMSTRHFHPTKQKKQRGQSKDTMIIASLRTTWMTKQVRLSIKRPYNRVNQERPAMIDRRSFHGPALLKGDDLSPTG